MVFLQACLLWQVDVTVKCKHKYFELKEENVILILIIRLVADLCAVGVGKTGHFLGQNIRAFKPSVFEVRNL